jgi:hypothetical protein
MGTYTFAQFKDYVALAMGQRSDLQTASLLVGGSTEMYGVWVNASYMQLTTQNRFWGLKRSFYFPELETVDTSQSTTDGQQYINVPSDCLVIRHVWDYTNDFSMEQIPWREYLKKSDRMDTSVEGKPTMWTRSGSYIYLYPTPDSAYNLYVYYRKRPALLTGTNTTAIGAEWDEPIVYLATYKAFLQMGRYQESTLMKNEFLSQVSSLMGIYDQEERDQDMQIYPDMSEYKE